MGTRRNLPGGGWLRALGLAVAVAAATSARAQDADLDGIPNASDNCPLAHNPDQIDSGGVDGAGPDGIGNRCQCGDFENDGDVDLADIVRLRRYAAALPPSTTAGGREKCQVNADGICNAGDAADLREVLAGIVAVPGAFCEAAAPPVIQLSAPSGGSTFTLAPLFTVAGVVLGAEPSHATVFVNDTPVPLRPDATFVFEIALEANELFHTVTAELVIPSTGFATRDIGHVIFGDSIADGAHSPMAIALRITDDGFDQIEPNLTALVPIDIETLIPPGTVLISNFCAIPGPFGLCLTRADVIANAASFADFSLDVDAMTDFAAGDVRLNGLFVDVHVDGGLLIQCDADVSADTTDIFGDYTLDPSAADPNEVDVNAVASVDVQFSNFDFDFTSGLCDFPLIGDLIQLIIGDVEPTVRQGLIDFLDDPDGSGPLDGPIADAIEVALNDLKLAEQIGGGIGVTLMAPLFDLEVDATGVTLDTDASITAATPDPFSPDLTASLHVDEAFPQLGSVTPGGLPFDIGLCISSSTFNQLLKAETESGLIGTTITALEFSPGGPPTDLTALLLSFFIPEFSQLPFDTPMQIDIFPDLAPVVTGEAGPAGEIGQLALAGLRLTIFERDTTRRWLSASVELETGFDLVFDPNSAVVPALSVPDPADIAITVITNEIDTSEESLVSTLPIVLAPLLPGLSDALGDIPLPEFFGLGVSGVEVAAEGEFMSIFLDLVPPPPAP